MNLSQAGSLTSEDMSQTTEIFGPEIQEIVSRAWISMVYLSAYVFVISPTAETEADKLPPKDNRIDSPLPAYPAAGIVP